jgi:hypothetical protein
MTNLKRETSNIIVLKPRSENKKMRLEKFLENLTETLLGVSDQQH